VRERERERESFTNHSNVAVWVAMQTRIEVGVMAHFFGVELDKNEEIHKQIKKLKGMRKQTNYALVEKIFGGLYIAQRERKKKRKRI